MSNVRAILDPALDQLFAPPSARYEAGRSRRDVVPLESHADLAGDDERVDPLDTLAEQDKARLTELIPLRYGRMSRTPFTFLRGAAAVMASDLARGPITDLKVELCGDAHLGNFRLYYAPDRRLVFDLNDFDETLPGPFEWDVKRLATSVMVAARSNGFSSDKARSVTRAAMRYYREFVAEASELNPLDLYYYRFESEAVLDRIQRYGKKHRRRVEKVMAKASRKNSLRALNKLTDIVNGRRVIVPDPPLVVRIDERLATENMDQVTRFYEQYRATLPLERRMLLDRFSLVDVARKVVGVGSVGTRCLILLLEAGDGTPLFLQFKQAVQSVLEPHLGTSVFGQAGQRVVEGQRLIQATSDVFLGWSRWQDDDNEFDFYIRQLWDGKGKLDIETMGPKRLAIFAGMCGKTLAFAHARSGDAMMILGYIDDDEVFDDVMVEFADRYADRTERDHAELIQQVDDGAIKVIRDI
ncbi:MAG: DUF2252 domain-containing protein [Arenicellales bacterium]|nr:DUF2252 domain-containing protein [Arenicellales bacterium]